MSRIRPTRRIGTSDFIKLAPNDKSDLNIEVGVDDVDIEDITVVKNKEAKE